MSNYKVSPTDIDWDGTRIYRLGNQIIRLKRVERSWRMFERGPDGALCQQPQRFSNLHNAERWMFENTYTS